MRMIGRPRHFAPLGLLLLFFLPGKPVAQPAVDTAWEACRAAAETLETLENMPEGILTAIALTESGRSSPEGDFSPWPWTIYADGSGQVFRTKEEAIQTVRRLLKGGVTSIDVGCMQVNLKYHPRAFTSLEEAFDPLANIAYGSSFVLDLKERYGDWDRAVRHYHSLNPRYNNGYRERVMSHWKRELKRRAAVAAQIPGDAPAAATTAATTEPAADTSGSAAAEPMNSAALHLEPSELAETPPEAPERKSWRLPFVPPIFAHPLAEETRTRAEAGSGGPSTPAPDASDDFIILNPREG